MTLNLSPFDIIIVAGALLSTMYLGLKGASGASRHYGSSTQYVLAGRALTLPLFVVSLVATWYGAVLGSGEFVLRHGIVMLVCFGLPYYIAALLYAWWFVPRYRRSRAISIPDILGEMYGPSARRSASVVMLVMTIPAAYVLMVGTFIDSMTGWGRFPSMLLGAVISASVVVRGGLRSHALANVIQFLLMFAGFAVLLAWNWMHLGSPYTLYMQSDPLAFDIPGTLGWPMVGAWWVIALQTFIDPNIHQRVAAISTTSQARRGIALSVGFWFVFDVLQVLTGLYARAHLTIQNPIETYIVAADTLLPVVWKGIFVAGLLSAIISTLDGYALVAGATLTHDLLPSTLSGRWRYPIGLVIVFAMAIAIATMVPSVVELLFYAASVGVPAFLPSILLGFVNQRDRETIPGVALILLPGATAASVIAWQHAFGAPFSTGAEGMIAGLIVSAVILIVVVIRRHYQGGAR